MFNPIYILVCPFLFLALFANDVSDAGFNLVLEENQKYSLFAKYSQVAIWSLKNNTNDTPVATCGENNCVNMIGALSPYANFSINASSTQADFITNRKNPFNFNFISWNCCEFPAANYTWNVFLYSKPQSVVCDSVLENDASNVFILCEAYKIYPEANCSILVHGQIKIKDEFLVTSQTLETDPLYYKTNCSTTIPIALLGTGIKIFNISIYPNIIDGRNHSVERTTNITLELRSVALQACPDEADAYLEVGQLITCTCYEVGFGNLKGSLQWFNDSGNRIDAVNGYLSIKSSPTEQAARNYTCKNVPNIENISSKAISFTAKFAYGPTSLEIWNISSNFPVNLCFEKQNSSFTIHCAVQKQNAYPDVRFYFTQGQLENINSNSSYTTKYYVSSFQLNISGSGILKVGCKAENSVFKKISTSQFVDISVREPPSAVPKLKFNNSLSQDSEFIKEYADTTVVCQVEGGFPDVHHVILKCANDTKKANGSSATLDFRNVSRYLSGENCSCTAEHVTDCYKKISTVFFNVAYPAEITEFSAGINASDIVIRNNTELIFHCIVYSNPPANTTIAKLSNLFQIHNGTTTTMLCMDTGVYVCRAVNSLYDETQVKYLNIFVLCPYQLIHPHKDSETFPFVKGSNVLITINVTGYPKPLKYVVQKRDCTNCEDSVIYSNQSNEMNALQLNHTFTDVPVGYITFYLPKINSSDFGNYSLFIENGIGDGLKYYFRIEETTNTASVLDKILGASIGGGIAFFVLFVSFLSAVLKGREYIYMNQSSKMRTEFTVQERNNQDIYFQNLKGNPRERLFYKNYYELDIRTTTAAAFPLNHKDTDTSDSYNATFVENQKNKGIYVNTKS